MFMWGYCGWGNAAAELVKMVNRIENDRGFRAPVFVDIRMKRGARAVDFRGRAFGQVVGPSRYETMSALGNEVYLEKSKRRLPGSDRAIVIHDPNAADPLLTRAVELDEEDRRIVFFCWCQYPECNSQGDDEPYACHRSVVAKYLLRRAEKRGINLEVSEWPGGQPQKQRLNVSAETFDGVRRGRKFVPLPSRRGLWGWAALPWGSTVALHCRDLKQSIASGPAVYRQGEWALPVLMVPSDDPMAALRSKGAKWRTRHGMDLLRG